MSGDNRRSAIREIAEEYAVTSGRESVASAPVHFMVSIRLRISIHVVMGQSGLLYLEREKGVFDLHTESYIVIPHYRTSR